MDNNMNYWPYTNIHELNLDWIIAKIKELDTRFTDDIETFVREYIDEHFAEWTVNANYRADDETIIYTNGTGATLTVGDVKRFAIDNAFVNIKDPTARTAASNAAAAAAAAQSTADSAVTAAAAAQSTADNAVTAAAAAQSTADRGLTNTATTIFSSAITPSSSSTITYEEYTLDHPYTDYKYLFITIGNFTNINGAITIPVSIFANTSSGVHISLDDETFESRILLYKGNTTSKIMAAYVGSNTSIKLQIFGLS